MPNVNSVRRAVQWMLNDTWKEKMGDQFDDLVATLAMLPEDDRRKHFERVMAARFGWLTDVEAEILWHWMQGQLNDLPDITIPEWTRSLPSPYSQ